jgi:hypothetical protein
VIEALAVAVDSLAVEVVTLDGVRSEARIFLHAASERHLGPETLAERIDGRASQFLPCEVGGSLELVTLVHVAYIGCPPDLPELASLDELASFRAGATPELASGERLAGELRYRLPPTSSRISDLLNSAARFLLLTTDGRKCYGNRRAIVRVRKEDSRCR